MRVLFTRNIGVGDAARYGMSFDQCRAGNGADVSQQVADELLARGLATEVVAAPKANERKAIENVAAEKAERPKPAKPADSSK